MKKYLFMFGIMVVSFLFLTVGVGAKEYKTYTIGQEIRFNPVTGKYCNRSKNCYTFNVINTNKYDDYIEMMLNFNLIPSVNLKSVAPYSDAIDKMKDETTDWVGVEKYTSSREDIITIDAYNDEGIALNFNTSRARLATAQEIAALTNATTESGDNFAYDYNKNHSDFSFTFNKNLWASSNFSEESYGYWTPSPAYNANELWAVKGKNLVILEINDDENETGIGLRPVVKIRKLELTENIEDLTEPDDIEPEDVTTKTVQQEKNPSTSDSILSIITIMMLVGVSSLIIVKKVKNN